MEGSKRAAILIQTIEGLSQEQMYHTNVVSDQMDLKANAQTLQYYSFCENVH